MHSTATARSTTSRATTSTTGACAAAPPMRVSAAFTPFVDVLVDARRYDASDDQYRLSAQFRRHRRRGSAARSTSQGILTGSVDFGYGARNYQDPRLANLASPLFDASLIWTATALTTCPLKSDLKPRRDHQPPARPARAARNHARESTTRFAAADALRDGELRDRRLCRHAAAGTRRPPSASSASYNINRDVVLKASASRQFYVSNQPGTNYAATIS